MDLSFLYSDQVTTATKTAPKPMVFDLDIINPPPSLILLINPQNLDVKFTPKITEQRVRWTDRSVGYVFHAHHDELDTLSASGKSAMFMTPSEGLSVKQRTTSIGYQNIEKLVAIYRNNGMNFNPKTNSAVNPAKISSIGRVVITYNGFIYRGHFLSFSYTQNESQQFNADFSFEYKVTQVMDIGQISSNNVLFNSIVANTVSF